MQKELATSGEQPRPFYTPLVEKAAKLAKSIKRSPKTAMEWAISRPFTRRLMGNVMPYLADTTSDLTEFDYSEFDAFDEEVDPQTTSVVVVASHFSHGDGRITVHLADKVRSKFPFINRVRVPISQTLKDGRQGAIGQVIYLEWGEADLLRNDIDPLYVYTANDRNKRNAVPTSEEGHFIKNSIKHDATDPQTATIILAGGTVEPGRHNKDGSVKGLQEITDPFLPLVSIYTKDANMRMLVVPTGISRTYRILSADNIFPTWESGWNLLKRRLGFSVDKLALVKVGRPFWLDPQIDRKNINDVIMRKYIAPLVVEKDQGHYKNPDPINQNGS